MSVTTTINYATNPAVNSSTSGWLDVDGSGGVSAIVRNSGLGYSGNGFARVTWSTATTVVSGGLSYAITGGLQAARTYTVTVWVRSSKTQRVNAVVAFRNSSLGTVNTVTGPAVNLSTNYWKPVTVTGLSGSAVTNLIVTVQATSGGALWAVGNTFDGGACLIQNTSAANPYFDGNTPDDTHNTYKWNGTANASTSTDTVSTPGLTIVPFPTFDPTPRAEITIDGLWSGTSTVNVWRISDGKRQAVRGARRRVMVAADFVTDYEVPLGRQVSYSLEILDGPNSVDVPDIVNVRVDAPSACIQDPLNPTVCVPVAANHAPAGGGPVLSEDALVKFDYVAAKNTFTILGSPEPVALMGQRLLAGGVNFSVLSLVSAQTQNIRALVQTAPLLLIRPLPVWGDYLPGLCYVSSAAPSEVPVDVANGGSATQWAIVGDLVAAPTMNVVIAVNTYGSASALFTTYGDVQSALAGKTYLYYLKSPSGV